MSPRIALAASLSSSPPKLGAVTPPPTPTDFTMVVSALTVTSGVSDSLYYRMVINNATTNSILQEGNAVATGNRMNGTVTVTVEDTVALTSGTIEAYIYYETNPTGATIVYLLSPADTTSVVIADPEAKFDLSTFSTNMAPATGEFNVNLSTSMHINTFESTVTVSGTEYQPNQSAETADYPLGIVIGA